MAGLRAAIGGRTAAETGQRPHLPPEHTGAWCALLAASSLFIEWSAPLKAHGRRQPLRARADTVHPLHHRYPTHVYASAAANSRCLPFLSTMDPPIVPELPSKRDKLRWCSSSCPLPTAARAGSEHYSTILQPPPCPLCFAVVHTRAMAGSAADCLANPDTRDPQ